MFSGTRDNNLEEMFDGLSNSIFISRWKKKKEKKIRNMNKVRDMR